MTLDDHSDHNLPVQLTRFIGREREKAEVSRLLTTARLLTLTGPGGCGKTRLALEVAAGLSKAQVYPAGVWLVELASLLDPALLPQAVGSALDVREAPGQSFMETLTAALQSRRLLLLLDNCEHLSEACAQLADALLRACPHLRLLATGREPLHIAGEVTWLVPPLSLPDPQHLPPLDDLAQYEAVQLFLDRAAAALPAFTLTEHNAAALADVCYRLDGMPLAIELAAAWVKVLSVGQIAKRLVDCFRLLIGRDRMALTRQQTLKATLDWSYGLLSEPERMLFHRLAVFAGGFTLEAAESVCVGQGVARDEVLDLLSHLVDKSMVVMQERAGEARYWMLETIRQYAREKLLESGEVERVRHCHLSFFMRLAEETKPQLRGPDQMQWLTRLEAEHDNLRAALDWSITRDRSTDSEQAVGAGFRLAGALAWFWFVRGYISEGCEWLSKLLSLPERLPYTQARATALHGAGSLERSRHNYDTARALLEEGLAIRKEMDDRRGIAESLVVLGSVARNQGDVTSARVLNEKSLAIFRELSDRQGIADALTNLAKISQDQRDWTAARALHEECLAMRRALDDRQSIAASLGNIGFVTLNQGDFASARSLLEEGLSTFRESGHRRGAAWLLDLLGEVARCQADYERAEAFYNESLMLWREMGLQSPIPVALHNVGYAVAHQGDYQRAVALFGESLIQFYEQGRTKGVALCLVGLAGVAVAQMHPVQAARLIGAAEALHGPFDPLLYPSNRAEIERIMAVTRAQLDEVAFAAVWAEGRAMTMEQAIELALSHGPPAASQREAPPTPAGLTPREIEVLCRIAAGKSNQQIADELVLSIRTVERHISNIYEKIGIGGKTARAAATAYALSHGLTPH